MKNKIDFMFFGEPLELLFYGDKTFAVRSIVYPSAQMVGYFGITDMVVEGQKYDTIKAGMDYALYTVRKKARDIRTTTVHEVYPPYDEDLQEEIMEIVYHHHSSLDG